MRFIALACLINVAVPIAPVFAAEPGVGELPTIAEKSGYRATASYQEVMDFCETLAERSELVTLLEFGKSHEGRSLPLLVFSKAKLPEDQPWKKSKLPAIICVGNIHAGEVCGKEALLMLARELGDETPPLLDHFVLLIAPIYNADGNERVSKDNRPGQVGPEEGMGQRANAMGLDLNRDFVKLASPETHAMVRLIRNWDPAFVIDTHTTNGSHHRYTLTYGGPRHPATDTQLANFVRETFLPSVTRRLAETTEFDTFFYGNFDAAHERWTTYPALPRYGAHYVGLRNRISILSEAYSYAPYKDRMLATRAFVAECLQAAIEHREQITKLIRDADAAAKKAEGDVALRHRIVPYEEKLTVKGFVEEERDGEQVATSEPRDYEVEYWAKSITAQGVPLPGAYLLAAGHDDVVENLQRHGIEVEALREDIELDVEVSRIGELKVADGEFEGHHLVSLAVEREPYQRRFPAGTIVVRTAQRLGKLAALLLEAESEDGLATWNFFDAHVELGGEYPVYRLVEAHTLLTAAIRPLAEDRTFHRRVTFESLYGKEGERVDFSPTSTRVHWLEDGQHFLQTREDKLHKVHALSGLATRFPDPAKTVASLQSIPAIDAEERENISERASYQWNTQKTAAVIVYGDDLYHLPIDGSPAVRLTRSRGEEEFPQYSPDGKFVAYVRHGNLFVSDIQTQTEQALTDDGDDRIYNGKASWVYFEEVYDRSWRAFWWSPDSRHVAFHRFDDTGLPTFHALDSIPRHGDLKSMAHPKPGDPNPDIELGVAHVSGSPVEWLDLSPYTAGAFIITYVGWQPDGDSLYFYVQDRAQKWLDFRTCELGSTESKRLFRETTEAWVDNPGEAWWVDGEIVFLSERSGWKHLYAFDRETEAWRSITEGEWEIQSVHRVDKESRWIFFSARKRSSIAIDFYRCRIDGSDLERLTQLEGSHRIDLAPAGNLAVASWSSFESSGDVRLINLHGQKVRMLDSRPSFVLEEFELGKFEHRQISTEDGFLLEATLTLPPDFDDSQQYPVWFTTYGGPHAPTVRDAYESQMHGHMLANLGLVVFRLDPRSASGKGAQSTWTAYRQLGVQELADIQCGIGWLKKKPYIDSDRIGMSGHSYGGYMTAYAMTHSKLFAAGISGAPVTDWHNYDSIYTERYMDTPQENPKGYEKTSVVKAADKLHGKLLLLHGLMDDNVHLQNSTQFMRALQRAGKDFEVMFYPQRKHGLRGDHYHKLVVDFIKESLGLEEGAIESVQKFRTK